MNQNLGSSNGSPKRKRQISLRTSCALLYCVCIVVLHTSVAGLLARSQYTEGPATGHPDTGFSWFPRVCKRMLRWFPRLQVATACFSCSPPNRNFLDPYFIFMNMHYNHCHRTTAHMQLNILHYYYYYYYYIIKTDLRTIPDEYQWWKTYLTHNAAASVCC